MINIHKETESKIIFGDFNIPSLIINKTRRQKISKDTEELNNIINQLDVMRLIEHSTQLQQNTYSSQVHTKHLPRQNIS